MIKVELWDVYDKDRNKLNKTWIRGEAMQEGECHMVVEVWTINDKHQLLVTQRDPVKQYGGLWECTGGAAIAGEASIDAIQRELHEETGLMANPEEFTLSGSDCFPDRHYFLDTYIYHTDKKITDMVWQPGEVIDGKYVSMDEFEEMNRQGLVAPPVWRRFQQYKEVLMEETK